MQLESKNIHKNCARCDTCREVVESKHRHDFRWCGCGKLAVDGGREYLRRAYSGPWTEMSEYLEFLPNAEKAA